MTFDALIYFALLALWSAVIAYLLLFRVLPLMIQKNHATPAHRAPAAHHPAPHAPKTHVRRTYSSHDGFRSLAHGAELTVEDIVKGLSKEL